MSAQPPTAENGNGISAASAAAARAPAPTIWRSLDMTGKVVLITGGNEGIGKETALDLAKRKAKVIIACRNVTKGRTVADAIIAASGNSNVLVKPLDLCNFKSVRALADDVLKTEEKLHVLINNAGAFFNLQKLSVDHVECTFSTNYLGHFLLTLSLLPLLKKTGSSRVVMLSSMLYLAGHVDFENLNGEKSFGHWTSYCNAKLAVMLFGRELARRLEGTNVHTYMVDPGIVRSSMTQGTFGRCFEYTRYLPTVFQTPEEGASSSIYAACCVDVGQDSGRFYSKCKERSVAPQACNNAVARKLWSVSEKLCGAAYE